jgi:hypothetical protein
MAEPPSPTPTPEPTVELFVITQVLAALLKSEPDERRSQFIVDLMRQSLDFRESFPDIAGSEQTKLRAATVLDQIANDLVRSPQT